MSRLDSDDYRQVSQIVGTEFLSATPPGVAAGSLAVVVHPMKKVLEGRVDRMMLFLLRIIK